MSCADALPLTVEHKANLKAVTRNHNRKYSKVSKIAMNGKFDWICTGIYNDVPPGYQKAMNESIDAFEARRGTEPWNLRA